MYRNHIFDNLDLSILIYRLRISDFEFRYFLDINFHIFHLIGSIFRLYCAAPVGAARCSRELSDCSHQQIHYFHDMLNNHSKMNCDKFHIWKSILCIQNCPKMFLLDNYECKDYSFYLKMAITMGFCIKNMYSNHENKLDNYLTYKFKKMYQKFTMKQIDYFLL